jgi:hypothetical protein
VHLEHGVNLGWLDLIETTSGAEAGVVDQQVQAGQPGDVLFEAGDAFAAGQVGGQRGGGDGIAGLKLGGQRFQALAAAGAQHQVVALGG